MMSKFQVLHPQRPFEVEADEFKYSAESKVFVLLNGDEKVAVIPADIAFYMIDTGEVPEKKDIDG
jgi:hypothetical protein